LVTVAALPVILIPQVPLALVPVLVGTSKNVRIAGVSLQNLTKLSDVLLILNAIAPLIVAWLANSDLTNLTFISPLLSLTATVLTVLACAELNPFNRLEFKFETTVFDATINGAVPLATVDCTVVNLPVVAVVAPMVMLLILPATAGLIVTVAPVPVGLKITAAFDGDNVTVELAVKVVNAPVLLVVAPILILLIVPKVAGAIVTVPVPVGLNVTAALAGLILVVDVELNPANVLDNPVLTAPVTPIPPVTTNVPVDVEVLAVLAVKVVAALLVKVVNAPELRTAVPIGEF
jgi:hypothetical protein